VPKKVSKNSIVSDIKQKEIKIRIDRGDESLFACMFLKTVCHGAGVT